MTIENNKVVSVNYHLTGKIDGGEEELIEQTSDDNPFVFLFGTGGILEDFENFQEVLVNTDDISTPR